MDDIDRESFSVLSQDSDAETDIQEGDWTPDFQKNQKRLSLIRRIRKHCGKDDGITKPLNVVVIGPAGVGKSAFINTVGAAFDGVCWREHSYSGSHDKAGDQITVFTTSYEKCCNAQKYPDDLLPTLIDVAGFHDEASDKFVELLRIVFYGRLPVGESLAEAERYYNDCGLEGLRSKYNQNNEKLKVDRVIFLSSATQDFPENLISCVIQAARPSGIYDKKRTIPLFGVMTKYDKVIPQEEFKKLEGKSANIDVIGHEDYAERESKFIKALGLGGSKHRFLRCSNYCDDTDKDNTRIETVIPDLDLPVLKFFTQVSDPVMQVLNKGETYSQGIAPETIPVQEAATPTQTPAQKGGTEVKGSKMGIVENFGETGVSVLLITIEAIFVAFFLSLLLKPQVDVNKVKVACQFMSDRKTPHAQAGMTDICKAVSDSDVWAGFTFYLALLILIVIRVASTLFTINIFRRN
ncbi:uncharacterized protein LOC124256811 [Haliotis rubra]|uniref:uncharacterized protein LOC124256811 n=1 Tax=Haliotis rubra TaxID=36100 RepID=UPI001EE601B0|nr:uncharacterized protein LOC124256811 [Haliotis rubra]